MFVEVDPSCSTAVSAAVSGLCFDAVLPLCDATVETAADLSCAWGLPHPSISACRTVRCKSLLKQRLLAHNVPTASHQLFPFHSLSAGHVRPFITPPWIVKPSRSVGGSEGVFAADSMASLTSGLRLRASCYADTDVLIEPYLQGTEHSLEIIVDDGLVEIMSISDKVNYRSHPSVVQSLVFPGPIGWSHQASLRAAVEKLPAALGLVSAVIHAEFIITQSGPFLIDLSLRPGGSYNLYPIVMLSTGCDYPGAIACALSRHSRTNSSSSPSGVVAWHFFDPSRLRQDAQRLIDSLLIEPDVIVAELLKEPQLAPLALLDDADRPGYVMVLGPDANAAMIRAMHLADRLYVPMD